MPCLPKPALLLMQWSFRSVVGTGQLFAFHPLEPDDHEDAAADAGVRASTRFSANPMGGSNDVDAASLGDAKSSSAHRHGVPSDRDALHHAYPEFAALTSSATAMDILTDHELRGNRRVSAVGCLDGHCRLTCYRGRECELDHYVQFDGPVSVVRLVLLRDAKAAQMDTPSQVLPTVHLLVGCTVEAGTFIASHP